MFECTIQMLLQFINIIPAFIVLILIMNLISDLLWG